MIKVKEESEKAGSTFKKTNIIVPGLIISWQIDGKTMETMTDFILGSSKITVDGDCKHETKRCLFLKEKL